MTYLLLSERLDAKPMRFAAPVITMNNNCGAVWLTDADGWMADARIWWFAHGDGGTGFGFEVEELLFEEPTE